MAGRSWAYRYTANQQLEFIDYPDGSHRQYHYNETALTSQVEQPTALTGITDERGLRYASYEYADDGRAKASYHAGNAGRVDISYDDLNRSRTVTNSRGDTSTYTTEVQQGLSLISVITGPGCSNCGAHNASYQYDPANNTLLSKTEDNITTRFGNYDNKGQVGCKTVGVTAADLSDTRVDACAFDSLASANARRIDYSYDSRFFNKITRITEPSVNPQGLKVTTHSYDDFGNRTSTRVTGYQPNPQGAYTAIERVTRAQFNGPLNQLSFEDGPRTDINDYTWYRYYANDAAEGYNRSRLKEVENANGVLIRSNIQYSATGNIVSEDRPNGLRLNYVYYSGNDRLATLTESDGINNRVTLWTYLATGEVETLTTGYGMANSIKLVFGYDAARRLTRISDDLGNSIEYLLDTEGNRLSEKVLDASGLLTRQLNQTFDLYNRLDSRSQENESASYHFEPEGTLQQESDGNGSVTRYSYDALQRLTQVVRDENGSATTTAYAYDAADHLTRVTDPVGGSTHYLYDDLGRLLQQRSPDTGTTTFSYDAAGNLKTKVDALGKNVAYSYDALNRLSTVTAPSTADNISYVYDNCSNGQTRLCSVTRNGITVDYSYTAFGELATHQGMAYSYDAAGRLRTLTYPSGAVVTYHYAGNKRISRVELQSGTTTTVLASDITYYPFGPVSNLNYGNGLSLNQSLDTAYRPTRIQAGSVLDLSNAQYDPNGNLQQRNDNGSLRTYPASFLSWKFFL